MAQQISFLLISLAILWTEAYGVGIKIPSFNPKNAEYLSECRQELNIDLNDLKKEDEEKLKCVGVCVGKKAGLISENDEFVMDKINEKFNPNNDKESEDILKECTDSDGEDICGKVIDFEKCLMENADYEDNFRMKVFISLRKCMKENGVERLPNSTGEISSEPYRCINACVHEKIDWMNEDGIIDKTKALDDLKEIGEDEDIQKCFDAGANEPDKCTKSNELEICLQLTMLKKRLTMRKL